jgi:DNA repair protein RadC
VFKVAILANAAAIVVLHNHPSGDPLPSAEDYAMTERLVAAGRILGIRVLDHVVVGDDDYFSFADAGRLDEGSDASFAAERSATDGVLS